MDFICYSPSVTFAKLWELVRYWEDRNWPTRFDNSLQPVVTSKIRTVKYETPLRWRRCAPKCVGERNVTGQMQSASGQGSPLYRGFMITLRHTTCDRTPLDEWSVRRRDLYLITKHSQETDIHAAGGIRTHNPSKRAAKEPRLRTCGHWDRQRLV